MKLILILVIKMRLTQRIPLNRIIIYLITSWLSIK